MRSTETGTAKTALRDLFTRLAPLEQEFTRIDTEVKGLRGEVGEIKTMLISIGHKLNRGTDWNVLAAWAGFVLLLCGSVGKLVADPLAARIACLEEARVQSQEDARLLERLDERSRWLAMVTVGSVP